MDFRFELEQHPKRKGKCPQCGHNQVFRFYQDLEGNRIDTAGRCERVNSCGYHKTPTGEDVVQRQIFTETPKEVKVIHPSKELRKSFWFAVNQQGSPLHKYLINVLGISPEHLKKWFVGSEFKHGKVLTVFVFVNRFQKCVNAKWFFYQDNGKRNKTYTAHSLKQPEDQTKKYEICLYGEHLLDTEKQKPVAVVESEKTALIASYFFEDVDWIAISSKNGLTGEKIQALFGRKIYFLCDADKSGRENSSINNLKTYEQNYEVIDLFPDREDGSDIADGIIEGIIPVNLPFESVIKTNFFQ